MNWIPRCAICISARKHAEARGDHLGAGAPGLPEVRHAHTLVAGTAVCAEHIIPAPVQPGAVARANGLLIPGG